MSEIRIVGPGKTRGYPYPVCKNDLYKVKDKKCKKEKKENNNIKKKLKNKQTKNKQTKNSMWMRHC